MKRKAASLRAFFHIEGLIGRPQFCFAPGAELLLAVFFAFVPSAAFPENTLDFAGAARLAVEASDELRGEYAARALGEGAWLWGIRSYLPRVSVTASEDDRLSETGADSFLKNYTVNLEQLVWDGGRLSLSRKLERMELDLSRSRLKQAASEIAETGVSCYRNVLMARSFLEIRKKTLDALDEQRRVIKREAELGLVRPSELLEAEVTVALAELETVSLSLDLEEAEWTLTEILGLEELPLLSERIDTERSPALPLPSAVRSIAESRSPELALIRYAIVKREAEVRAASLSWIPSLHLTGSFAMSGRQYPLSRYSWSLGFSVEFSSPWLSGNLGASAGRDPPYDKNARLHQTATPAPDPGAVFTKRSAELALALERSKYESARRKISGAAEKGVKHCAVLDKKRTLAVEALKLEKEKLGLAEVKLSLGEITRLELMEARLDYEEREAAVVEAAAALLQAERELERLLDLAPGELSRIAERGGGV